MENVLVKMDHYANGKMESEMTIVLVVPKNLKEEEEECMMDYE